MKICFFSDTHIQHQDVEIPEADILIFAGDGEFRNKLETLAFKEWLDIIPMREKYIICGNHDFYGEKRKEEMVDIFKGTATYLHNDLVTLSNGMTMWGSPMTPIFYNWAFMDYDSNLSKLWATVPKGVDILLTHGPAKGTLDIGRPHYGNVGSESLAYAVKQIKPKYHVFGHIHGSYGTVNYEGTTSINCSLLDEDYFLVNKPIVIEV